MDHPTLLPSRRVGPDTDLIPAYAPLPGLGVIAVNAYLVRAREPMLIDTGLATLRDGFMRALRALIDPAELRWIWVTHADADHVGNLREVLAEAPRARIVTNYLGMGKLSLQQMPLDRTWLINPGQTLSLGDREVMAQRPPTYDAPETMAAFDTRTRHLFTSDCFGAVLAQPAESASDIATRELHEGLALWSRIDAPWLHQLGNAGLATASRAFRDLRPSQILGSHLPPATGMDEALYRGLSAACEASPFVGPDQASLEAAAREAEVMPA